MGDSNAAKYVVGGEAQRYPHVLLPGNDHLKRLQPEALSS
jgi:hypothetical protein